MRTLISCLLIGIAAVGQQSTSDLEARVRELESRASRADALAARVFDLERQLAGHEARAAGEALEEAINVLLATQDDAVVAHARKAQSLTIGGQLRLRAEYRLVSRYQAANPSTTDEDMVIQRTRINFDARVHEHIRIFAEIQDSRLWGEEMSVTTDLMGVDLHQGYIDFEQALGTPFTVRSGRFELKLWNQRLISPLDWHPVGRAWDGVLVFGKPSEDWLLHAGYHLIAEGGAIDSDQDTDLYWTAATYTGAENHELGAAFFWLHADTPPADSSFGTATVHANGNFGDLDYSVDLVAQFGDVGATDLEAYASAVEVGYTFGGDWKPRASIEWTWASGDDDPTDGDTETFNPLFPFGHYYQGYLDLFAWRNGHDVALHFQVRPCEGWWAEIAVHGFWLDDTDDAWYGANGMPIRFDPTASDSEVGYELDISVKHWITDGVWIWFGYSHFFAGDYVGQTGRSPDTDWFWLQLTADF